MPGGPQGGFKKWISLGDGVSHYIPLAEAFSTRGCCVICVSSRTVSVGSFQAASCPGDFPLPEAFGDCSYLVGERTECSTLEGVC